MDLHLAAATLGRYTVITARGELDISPSAELAGYLAAVLGQQPGRNVILDVNGISFADAAGLSALLAAERTVRCGGGSLRLAGPPRQLRKLLALTGLAGRLASYSSTYAASTWPPVPAPPPDQVPAGRPGPASPPAARGKNDWPVQLLPGATVGGSCSLTDAGGTP